VTISFSCSRFFYFSKTTSFSIILFLYLFCLLTKNIINFIIFSNVEYFLGVFMNVILLSGGSGKRLWPLSDDVKSKQFLKLFKDENGNYESMVQRVYRQIKSVNFDAKITIATSKMQVDEIKNQLGKKVFISTEPSRRDTFPAILLSIAYLHYELGVKKDEVVVVCPVDPYVDNTFYEELMGLETIVKNSSVNLTLMGINPTYNSDKYGYIIPENERKISKVKEFKEKPNRELAKTYIENDALWNAGVFAFKLEYLLNIAKKEIDFIDYKDLYEKYEQLEKISFDYAVVEKEKEVQVVRYNGSWKDVGTWDSVCEIMTEKIKGKGVIDNLSTNTQIINELDIPIVCLGCDDMVIVANEKGIFVSKKECAGDLKKYVDKI